MTALLCLFVAIQEGAYGHNYAIIMLALFALLNSYTLTIRKQLKNKYLKRGD